MHIIYCSTADLAAIIAGLVREGIVFKARENTNHRREHGDYEIIMNGGH